jgi:hypothetical protein
MFDDKYVPQEETDFEPLSFLGISNIQITKEESITFTLEFEYYNNILETVCTQKRTIVVTKSYTQNDNSPCYYLVGFNNLDGASRWNNLRPNNLAMQTETGKKIVDMVKDRFTI